MIYAIYLTRYSAFCPHSLIFFRRIYDRLPSSSPVRLYTRELTRIGRGCPCRHRICTPAAFPQGIRDVFRHFLADSMLTDLINKNDRNGHFGIHLPPSRGTFHSVRFSAAAVLSFFSSPPAFLSAPLPFLSPPLLLLPPLPFPLPSPPAAHPSVCLLFFLSPPASLSSPCLYPPPSSSLLRTLPSLRHAKRSGGSTAPAASHRFRVFDVLLCGLSLPLPVIPPRRAPRGRTASCPGCSGGPSGQPLQPPGRR